MVLKGRLILNYIFFNNSIKKKNSRYIKKLQEAVKGKTTEELKTDENKIKVTALKTTSNISILIRDLFHSPPSFKSVVHLSWITRKLANQQQVINIKKVMLK